MGTHGSPCRRVFAPIATGNLFAVDTGKPPNGGAKYLHRFNLFIAQFSLSVLRSASLQQLLSELVVKVPLLIVFGYCSSHCSPFKFCLIPLLPVLVTTLHRYSALYAYVS